MSENGGDFFCDLSDEAVVKLSQEGNRGATNHMVARYRNFVHRKANTYFLAGAETDDLAQEGMIGLYSAIKSYDRSCKSSFRAFAMMCITRQMISAVRAAGRKKHMPLNSYISIDKDEQDSLGEFFLEDEGQNPESILIDRENLLSAEQKIYRVLSKFELQVLMYYTSGMSYEEIADMTGKKKKSVDNAIQRIKKKLCESFK